jgi:SAM-dependent methyltransferase
MRASASRLRLAWEFVADAWFDRTRNVRTRGLVTLDAAGVTEEERRDSESYEAAGASYIRRAIADAGLKDFSGYTFVDMGSGMGRALFVAAEFPFARMVGVEFSPALHEQACANIRRFKGRKEIENVCANAREFFFPAGRLVVFFFNPFGAQTMRAVMGNLQDSLWRNARHVVVILLCPQCADEVLKVEGMRLVKVGVEWQVFAVGGDVPGFQPSGLR